MSVEPSPTKSDPISNFCAHVIATFATQWPVNESTIASEFVTFFHARDCTLYPQLVDLCLQLSVEVNLIDLPPGYSGMNVCYGNRRAILVGKVELPGLNREHTLLHELREIFEYKFRELGHPLAKKSDLEERAESFATLVRMECIGAVWSTLFKSVDNLQIRWQHIGAYVFAVVGAVIHLVSTAIPSLDYLASSDTRRRTNRQRPRRHFGKNEP